MKTKTKRLLVCLMLATSLLLLAYTMVNVYGSATIGTNKPDYTPGETVIISGSGFLANVRVTINIQRPDSTVNTIYAWTEGSGAFTCNYQLDGITGTYIVIATDGTNTASTTFTDAEKQTFYGWKMDARTPAYPNWPGDWVTGDLGSKWREWDWVSYILALDGYGGTALPDFDIKFDFYFSHKDAIFVDLVRNFSYCIRDPYPGSGKPDDVTPATVGTWRNGTFTPLVINRPFPAGTADSQTIPPGVAFWRLTPNPVFAAPVPTGKSVVIYFEARLAPSFIWMNGKEYMLNHAPTDAWGGDRYGPPYYTANWTAAHFGSGFTTGSSPHFMLEGVGVGEKTVPIPIPPAPTGEIHGTKYNDLNGNGTREVGEPGLANWTINLETIIEGIPFPATTTTASDGTYAFTGLVAANYTISEVLQAGWTQTAPKPLPPGTHTVVLAEGQIVTGKDFGNYMPLPNITLTKTPSSTKVENGTLVTYTYNVTNTGNIALTVNLTDNQFGPIFTGLSLAPGASYVTTITRVLTVTTTNVANATGVDLFGRTATATASATVTVLHPALTLTKTPSQPKIENNTSVTYTYNVTNTGDVALTVGITDDHFGTIASGESLAVGQSKQFTYTTTLTANTTNTATATGVDQTGASVQATASAFVHVLHPAIALYKTPSSSKVEDGSTVVYNYTVVNTGDTPLTVSLTDNVFPSPIWTGKVMAPGAVNTTLVSHVLHANTTNTATATGVDQTGASVSAQASAFVHVLHPAITLTKTPSSAKVENGSSVTYTYNVTNTGDVALTVGISDDQFGSITSGQSLAVGQWKTFTKTVTLTQNTTNTATATGVDQAGGSATATATAYVRVLHPSITLTKTPSSTKVENGSVVTYTYNVTNTGDVSLTVGLVDNVFGTIYSGQSLAAGASIITTANHVLYASTTNVANATGVDQTGASVSAIASATVTVLHPSITLTKTPSSAKVENGSSVTYTFNVTNTGDVSLTVSLTDTIFGTIFTGKSLAPGDSNITTISKVLTVNTTNIAVATGVDQLAKQVNATASAFVVVIHPAISVTKTGEPADQLAPGTITWTVIVTNTGDIKLTAVNISDTRHGVLGSGLTLNPGQNITYSYVESGLPPGTYYDNATAYGAYQLGTVSAWDDATCVVRPVLILKQFTGVTVLPEGLAEGFNATLVNATLVNVIGLKSGPKVYFTVTYYFENSLNFLGKDFDGQAHNFTLWDKWGGNLMALGSAPVAFNQTTNVVKLANNMTFSIDPRLTGPGSYRYYIGSGLNITSLASRGQAWITMHLGDQQNGTNPGNGKGTSNDGKSYDTDTVWYIGELGVNESATLTLYIAPGKNPGGQLLFTSTGCTVINTGPRVRAYGNTYANEDFLYAVERTNTLTVCVTK